MKIVFLHGVGQDETAWNSVITSLNKANCLSIRLFEKNRFPDDFVLLEDKIYRILKSLDEDFILVGLSLGGMLALDMLKFSFPNLKGLIISGGQCKLKGNFAYYLQSFLLALIPAFIFKKQGINKPAMRSFYASLAQFNLTHLLEETNLPIQLICGQKDKANLSASREMQRLIQHVQLDIIPNYGHTLNVECPELFADIIDSFLLRIKSD